MNQYLTHLNLNYNKQQLLQEFEKRELDPYTPSRPPRGQSWFSHTTQWLTHTVTDFTDLPEMLCLYNMFAEMFDTEITAKYFKLLENVELPPHTDMGHRACINIVLSDDPAPVWYKDYGDETYTCAMLNVAKRHGVKPGPERKMIKFQLGNIYYADALDKWNQRFS